jgi:FKBP-type peptidyl-prolyl cis-trans isomerase FklB
MKSALAIFTSVVVAMGFAGPVYSAEGQTPALTDLQVSFKLDPRLTRGQYLGELWVSPPTYTGTSGQDTVEARAQGTDGRGRPVNTSPKWIPTDPEMVTVSPSEGNQVKITVKRAGESRLQVTFQGVSKELSVKAAHRNNALQVEITQPVVPSAPAGKNVSAGQGPATAPAQDTQALKSERERLGYSLGMNFGSAIRKAPMQFDRDLLIKGLQDALSDSQTMLTETEMRATLAALQSDLKKEKAALQAARKNELAEKNKKAGEAFLAENKAKEGVVTLESGLQYKILKPADGRKPTGGDTVVAHYRGTFVDGTEFDSSYKHHKPATVALPRTIKGWNEALQLMPVGSKWQLFVPSNLAYGEHGRKRPGVAPNATLVFEVELISIQDRRGPGAQASVNVEDKRLEKQAGAQ